MPTAEQRYLDFCHQYVAGTLDIHAMHRAVMTPLAGFAPAQLHQWRGQFAQAMAQRLSPAARDLVARHRDAGDLCAIVTATSRWVAEPFAQAFGIAHLVATESVMVDGRPAGEIDGLPCYREHKPTRVEAWLAAARPTAAVGLRGVLVLLRLGQRPAAAAVRHEPRRGAPGPSPA